MTLWLGYRPLGRIRHCDNRNDNRNDNANNGNGNKLNNKLNNNRDNNGNANNDNGNNLDGDPPLDVVYGNASTRCLPLTTSLMPIQPNNRFSQQFSKSNKNNRFSSDPNKLKLKLNKLASDISVVGGLQCPKKLIESYYLQVGKRLSNRPLVDGLHFVKVSPPKSSHNNSPGS
jgi:hypothetical protein